MIIYDDLIGGIPWYTYPSEKYESGGLRNGKIKDVPVTTNQFFQWIMLPCHAVHLPDGSGPWFDPALMFCHDMSIIRPMAPEVAVLQIFFKPCMDRSALIMSPMLLDFTL